MAKNSAYQNEQKKLKHAKFKELRLTLPPYAHHYLDDMVVDYQINTILAYTRDLITFFEFLLENNPLCHNMLIKDIPLTVLEQLSYQDITEYRNYLASNSGIYEHSNQASSIERRMAPLRGMFADLYNNKEIANNPTLIQTAHRRKKANKHEITYLETDEISNLLYHIENSLVSTNRQQKFCEKSKKRDFAILVLLLHTGIRISECVGLDINDIDFTNKSIQIVRKGGFESTIYFNETVYNALTDYIETERKKYLPDGEEKALFLSSQKKRMAIRSMQAMVKKYSQVSVPNKHISAHKMRSTYGTALYEQTGDIRLVADVLGHSSIETTAKHYAAQKTKHLKKAGQIIPY